MKQLFKLKENNSNIPQIGEMIKSLLVELITAYSHINRKVKKLAEEVF